MKVAVAYDHRGRKGVESVKTTIEQQRHECIDLGPKEEGVVDCPDFAYVAGMMVTQKEADTAILLCTILIWLYILSIRVKASGRKL